MVTLRIGRLLGVFHHRMTREVDWYTTSDTEGRELSLSPAKQFPAGGGVADDGYLHLKIPEYGCMVHYDSTYSRTLCRGGAESGSQVDTQWWEKPGMDITGRREAVR